MSRLEISLTVKNSYESGATVVREFIDQVVPAPPAWSGDAFDEWVQEELIDRFTGTGEESGDAWYDVLVTWSSEPGLIGRTFTFG